METKEINQVQKLLLNLLKKYISICKEYNLTYYLTGGGLIGALRHKGFIPWDDDLDIVMPRKDYDKFVNICKQNLKDGYKIQNYQTDPSWYFTFSRFIDNETIIETEYSIKTQKMNLWLDVFPVDGLPHTPFLRKAHFQHILFYRYLIQIANVETMVGLDKINRPLYEKIIIYFFHYIPIGKIINSKKLVQKLEKVMRKYDIEHSDYLANLAGRYRMKEIMPKKYWGSPSKVEFEDIQVNAPQMYHEFQTHMYGDYMKVPPIKDRVTHKINIIKSRIIK